MVSRIEISAALSLSAVRVESMCRVAPIWFCRISPALKAPPASSLKAGCRFGWC